MSEQHEMPQNDYSFGTTRRSLHEWVEHFRSPALNVSPHALEECTLFVDLFGIAFDDDRKIVVTQVRNAIHKLQDDIYRAERAVEDSQRRPLPAKPKACERVSADRAKKREQVAITRSMLEVAVGCASRFRYADALTGDELERVHPPL